MTKKLVGLVIALMLAVSGIAGATGYYEFGDVVDDFTLQLTDGTEFVLSENLGKIVVVNLWATWCPNCVEYSIPTLAELLEMYPDDVAVVAVNCGDPAKDVETFAELNGLEYPIAIDEELDIMYNYFPVNSIPFTAFIDKEGRLYTASIGGGEGLTEYYAQIIDEMLAAE